MKIFCELWLDLINPYLSGQRQTGLCNLWVAQGSKTSICDQSIVLELILHLGIV